MFQDLVTMFERYRIKCRLHYKTLSSSLQRGNAKFVYFDDPCGAFGALSKTGNYPISGTITDTYTGNITNMANVSEGNLWLDFSTGWNFWQKGQDMPYTSAYEYNGQIDPSTIPAGQIRESTQGLWAIYGQGFELTPPDAPFAVGEIWMEMLVELCIMLPQQVSQPVGLTAQSRCKACGVHCKNCVRKRATTRKAKAENITLVDDIKETKAEMKRFRDLLKSVSEAKDIVYPLPAEEDDSRDDTHQHNEDHFEARLAAARRYDEEVKDRKEHMRNEAIQSHLDDRKSRSRSKERTPTEFVSERSQSKEKFKL
jgi:hypothetical protein